MKTTMLRLGYLLIISGYLALTTNVSAEEFPPVGRLVVIDSKKVFDVVGRNDIPKVNQYLNEVALSNGVGIVMQEASFASPASDITDEFIKGLQSKTSAKELNFAGVKTNPAVAIVNSEKLFADPVISKDMKRILISEFQSRQDALKEEARKIKESAQKLDADANTMSADARLSQQQEIMKQDKLLQAKQKEFMDDLNRSTFQERSKIADKYTPVIKQIAEYQGVDLVFQAAAYLQPEYDVTDDVIAILNKEKKLSDIKKREVFKKSLRVGIINSESIFATFPAKSRNDVASVANPIIKEFAIKNNIGIIFQSAAYSDKKFDITSQILSSLKTKIN